ncbi:hypothetical protein EDD21DRAFT_363319 [Dissophora ornata]|nr:hypothetical protein EDD21DRAFT_363319 [Dissophora ornata]
MSVQMVVSPSMQNWSWSWAMMVVVLAVAVAVLVQNSLSQMGLHSADVDAVDDDDRSTEMKMGMRQRPEQRANGCYRFWTQEATTKGTAMARRMSLAMEPALLLAPGNGSVVIQWTLTLAMLILLH